MWCQVGDPDLVALRDHVLVPGVVELLRSAAADPDASVALLGLLAATPAPDATDPTQAAALAAWNQAMAQIDRSADKLDKARPSRTVQTMKDRRANVARQRQNPPRALKKLNFCAAPADAADDPAATKP